MKQFKEEVKNGKIPTINPLHFMLNLSGLIIFPFVVSHILDSVGGIDKNIFNNIIEERKKFIPLWLDAMIKIEY